MLKWGRNDTSGMAGKVWRDRYGRTKLHFVAGIIHLLFFVQHFYNISHFVLCVWKLSCTLKISFVNSKKSRWIIPATKCNFVRPYLSLHTLPAIPDVSFLPQHVEYKRSPLSTIISSIVTYSEDKNRFSENASKWSIWIQRQNGTKKKTHKQPKIPRNPGQKQLYVMHVQDENKVSNILH
jgi:hypothetical protein